MRVIYDTTKDCKNCLYNKCQMCYKLSRPLKELCFEMDCPLPHLSDVEQYTRYVTKDKELKCHGNCKHWKHWNYNKALNTDIGICTNQSFKKVCKANNKACEEYEEV